MKTLSKLSLTGAAMAGLVAGLVISHHDSSGRVPVQGTVQLDGRPLVGADVILIPDAAMSEMAESSRTSLAASTDSLGHYQLPVGAVPGAYRVVVRGIIPSPVTREIVAAGEEPLDETQKATAAMSRTYSAQSHPRTRSRNPQVSLPQQYSSVDHTVLRLVVPATGLENAELNLKLSRMASDDAKSRTR